MLLFDFITLLIGDYAMQTPSLIFAVDTATVPNYRIFIFTLKEEVSFISEFLECKAVFALKYLDAELY